jgi:ubiquitin C-terminal hydrolase
MMNFENNNNGLFSQRSLDVMAFVGFIIGLANYNENLDQGKAQEMLQHVLDEVHGHLDKQDKKIDQIIEMLEGVKKNA